jgi:AcrR family transcriptional regulator
VAELEVSSVGGRAVGEPVVGEPVVGDAAADAPAETARRRRTRERLLDAAYEVFAEQGVHAATVEAVCDRAGFTRGAFYSNFSTKEELFFALMEREHAVRLATLDEQVEGLRPRLEAAVDPLDEEIAGELILELLHGPFDNRQWCLVTGEFELLAMRDPDVSADFLAYRERFEVSLVPIVERALDRAGLEFVLPMRAALRMIVAVYDDAVRSAELARRGLDEDPALRSTLARIVLLLTRPVAAR